MPKIDTATDECNTIPLGYLQDAQRLYDACAEWLTMQERPTALSFHDWEQGCEFAGPLTDQFVGIVAANEDTRAMLLWADERIGHRGTLIMAKAILELLFEHQNGTAFASSS